MLPWMDILFGTCHVPRKSWPSRYGINAPRSPYLAGQLLQPIRRNQSIQIPAGDLRPSISTSVEIPT
jgi:sterol desaturase/sphingolipid hydroxylase (fatty acid hydroxylase superfamily)